MKRKLAAALLLVLIFGGAACWLLSEDQVKRNNRELGEAIRRIHTDTVLLNEVTLFDWDEVYTPDPDQTKEEIEQMIGFSSPDIQDNDIGEGMTHLIFVKDQQVVCSILGRPEELGYYVRLDDDNCLSREENIWFRVLQNNGVIWLDNGVEELPLIA